MKTNRILLLMVALAGCNEATSGGWANPPAAQKPVAPTEPSPTATAPVPAATAVATELPTTGPNMMSFKLADGTYDLYVGPGVKEAMKKDAAAPAYGWYKLGRVKQAHVDKAKNKTEKVSTYSLEDGANADLDIEITSVDGAKGKSLKLKAGDPCVSGVVQVAIDMGTGAPSALFDIYHWVKYPNGPTVKNVYTTGILGDPEWPTLKNNGDVPPAGCK